MTEELIHFIWSARRYLTKNLTTTRGEPLRVITPGSLNPNAGPDYTGAKIKIGRVLWAGNIEFHIRSSDWRRHNHHLDPVFDSVILHVVVIHDEVVTRTDGSEIATFELKDRIPKHILDEYERLITCTEELACQQQLQTLDPLYVTAQLARSLVARMEEKSKEIIALLEEYKGSWEEVFYVILARSFGFKVNAVPFEMLARSLPLRILRHHRTNLIQVEALMFGQAGFLNGKCSDGYSDMLTTEYKFLSTKYQISPIDKYLWKFLRLHPQNFPTIRLAQFSSLIHNYAGLFSHIIGNADFKHLELLFLSLRINPYWRNHYRLGVPTGRANCRLGKSSVASLLVNAVAQTMFAYGLLVDQSPLQERAIALLESLPPESNKVTRYYETVGFSFRSAADSQAALQQKKEWCDKKNCLLCTIGVKILNVQ